MKTTYKLVCSAVAVLATMSFGAVCYADGELVDLPCCAGTSCPTKFESPGVPGVTQTATFKGVSVLVDGNRELLTTFLGDPGYKEWTLKTIKIPKKGLELIKAVGGAHVFAKCSSSTSVGMPKQRTLTCPEGDGIILEQDNPTCTDPETGPHSVVEITKVSSEEQESEAMKEVMEIKKEFDALVDKQKGIREQLRLERAHFDGLNRQVLGGGFLGTGSSFSH